MKSNRTQHAHHEDKRVRAIAKIGRPIFPDKRIASMACTSIAWQNSANDNRNYQSNNYQEQSNIIYCRQGSIRKENRGHRSPRQNQVADKDMPILCYIVRMSGGIHLHRTVGRDDGD